MTLKELKEYFEQLPKKAKFNFGISKPFSWRGSYDEVAFEILNQKMTREQILKNIRLAYTEKFYGYKGGEYNFSDYTEIHFESDYGSYTNGEYVANWIAKLENGKPIYSQEKRLLNLAFANAQST